MKKSLLSILLFIIVFCAVYAQNSVSVSGILISESQIDIKIGELYFLEATVLPNNATDKNIIWECDNPSVAEVYNGAVKGLNIGSANINAISEDGEFIAQCKVFVSSDNFEIAKNIQYIDLYVGETYEVDKYYNDYFRWDENKFYVRDGSWSELGYREAKNKGYLSYYSTDGCKVTFAKAGEYKISSVFKKQNAVDTYITDDHQFVVTKGQLATEIKLNKTSVTAYLGEYDYYITPTVIPENADRTDVVWESLDPEIARVYSDGEIYGVSCGTTTIKVSSKYNPDVYKSCKVTVKERPVSKVTLNKKTLKLELGDSLVLEKTISPANAYNKSVVWASSNSKVATVNDSGYISAIGVGTATITCTSVANSKATAKCSVTVYRNPVTKITLNKSNISLIEGDYEYVEATVSPKNATDKSLTWVSSNNKIAEVEEDYWDDDIKIIAKSPGTATITCKSDSDPSVTASVTVNVKKHINISLLTEVIYMYYSSGGNNKFDLKNIIRTNPNVPMSELEFDVSSSCANVNSDGILELVSDPTGSIYVYISQKGYYKDEVCLRVGRDSYPSLYSIHFLQASFSGYEGDTITIFYLTDPANVKFTEKATSSNSKVAKIAAIDRSSHTITVNCLTSGVATITIKDPNDSDNYDTCEIIVSKYYHVTGIVLDKNTMKLKTGKKAAIKATVNPSNATNKSVTWVSSNSKVATVDSKGNVTGVKAGSAVITVTSKDNSQIKATCKVTVEDIPVEKITLSESTLTLEPGKTSALKAKVTPTTATNRTVTWKSSNSKVATVDSKGNVKGVKAGTVTITATTNGKNKSKKALSATCKVTVKVPVTGVTISPSSISIYVGKSSVLAAIISPSGATNKKVTWKSSNKGVATVDSKGNVSGVKAGTATITVKTKDGSKTAKCSVTVLNPPVSKVKLSKNSLSVKVGKTATLKAKVSPTNAINKKVTWTSSDTKIATVDSKGVVKGISKGSAVITVTTKDGNKTDTCKVTVTK